MKNEHTKEEIELLKEKSDSKMIKGLKGNHLIVGDINRFDKDWIGEITKIGIGKNKGKYKFFTLISIGENLTLKDLGYNDKWSRKEKYSQTNITFLMSIEQMQKLRDLLNHKLKGIQNEKRTYKRRNRII